MDRKAFLPVDKQDLIERGIEQADFIVVSGDAYVDHPSFGHALIARLIESRGFSVGILAQPVTKADYFSLGKPKHAFLVASGVVDSMVNNYTVAKKKRSDDVYSEGGKGGLRPDRAAVVYSKYLKKNFPDTPVILGGIEASLRRLSHYDYWSDSVMRSILIDSGADLLVYGMGERPILDLLKAAERNIPLGKIKNVRGTAYITTLNDAVKDVVRAISDNKSGEYSILPAFDAVSTDKIAYAKAFTEAARNTDSINGKGLIQKQTDELYYVQNPPQSLLTEKEMDYVYGLPFTKKAHPKYALGVPALEEVSFSITAHRGCFGNCSFCALTFHQGRAIQRRSSESIINEAKQLSLSPDFKGYIHDVGGPTANFNNPSCEKQKTLGLCKDKDCIGYKPCANLKVDHREYLSILQEIRKLPGIKKVFVRSGVRFDYAMLDSNPQFLNELVKYHISGQLKVAPEHCCDDVLRVMNKPPHSVYESFCEKFKKTTERAGLDQYIVPYFISSHPGCTISDAVALSVFLHKINYMPKQVQDFYPTPGTLSTTMYYTGLDPYTLKSIYVAKSDEDKAMQRALLQYRLKVNRRLVLKALYKAGREDLIGNSPECLINVFNNVSQSAQKRSNNKSSGNHSKSVKNKSGQSSNNRKDFKTKSPVNKQSDSVKRKESRPRKK